MARSNTKFTCTICSKQFGTSSNRSRHVKEVHRVPYTPTPHISTRIDISCNEDNCNEMFDTIANLRTHLQNVHGQSFNIQTLTFPNKSKFLDWKEKLEQEEKVQFVKKKGDKRSEKNIKQYFQCNRSGSYSSQSTGRRTAKQTCKIGHKCTAAMTVTIDNTSEEVIIEFVKEHYGHETKVEYVCLPRSFRMHIVNQIKRRIFFNRILDFVRSSIDDSFYRSHLLTRLAVGSIQKAFHVKGLERDSNHYTSIQLFFDELTELQDQNPIAYYKIHGQGQRENVKNLKKDDTFIVILHQWQVLMLKKFGPKGICVDLTHGRNGCDFFLRTIIVVDERGEGLPAAWLITNRIDEMMLVNFFTILKERIGDLHAEWFMSEDSKHYYDAWISVFGSGPKKLLSAWDVDRAWRKRLPIIKSKEIRCEVYYKLCLLREEPNEAKLLELLAKVQQDFEENDLTKEFGIYFKLTYSTRLDQWAMCYRQSYQINANTYIEALHIFYVYMKRNINNRLDKCIHVLLSVIRDKHVERIIKLEKDKLTGRISDIEKCHRASLQLDPTSVAKLEDGSYLVTSFTENAEYTVSIRSMRCDQQCKLFCKFCKVCFHTTLCSCLDSLIRGLICKHIHLAARIYPSLSDSRDIPDIFILECSNSDEQHSLEESHSVMDIVKKIGGSEHQSDSVNLAQQQKELNSLLTEICTLSSSCNDSEILVQVNALLATAKKIMQTPQNQEITNLEDTASNISNNKNLETQNAFLSIRKNSRNSELRLTKFNFAQKYSINNNLLGQLSEHHEINEHSYAVNEPSTYKPLDYVQNNNFPIVKKTQLSRHDLELLKMITGDINLETRMHIDDLIIEDSEIICIPELAKNEIIEEDLTTIKTYLTLDAWLAVNILLQSKQMLLQCGICDIATATQKMISCNNCHKCFHLNCTNTKLAPNESVLCIDCHLSTL